MKKLKLVTAFFLFALCIAATGAQTMKIWPELSNVKSISGRAATENDIKDGIAVFLLESEGAAIGKPLNIKIPQYAIHTDGDTGEISKVVIIQGEKSITNDQKVIGAVLINSGEHLVGLYEEFKFLGTSKPND